MHGAGEVKGRGRRQESLYIPPGDQALLEQLSAR